MSARVQYSPEELAEQCPAIVFAVGSFDGVHPGHQAILQKTREVATAQNAVPWVLTFDPHPATLFSAKAPQLLQPLPQRLERVRSFGIEGTWVLPFTKELASLTPQEFADSVLGCWYKKPGRSCSIVSGPNWSFGRGGVGRLSDIPELTGGRVQAFDVPFMCWEGEPISSSRIRKALLAGKPEEAAAMLGRPYSSFERALAEPSRGVGTQLGTPTANIQLSSSVQLPCGVYVLYVRLGDTAEAAEKAKPMRAVANYGWRPSFPDARPEKPLLEVHILNFSEKLYGAGMQLEFLEYLRPERAFESAEALKAQIGRDIEKALLHPMG